MDIRLAEAAVENAAGLAAIQKLAFERLYNIYQDAESPFLRGADEFLRRLGDPRDKVYIIIYDGAMCGGIMVRKRENGEYYLARVFIHPELQGRGIATEAIKRCELRFPDAARWSVDFPSDQIANRRCYEKVGYLDTGTREIKNDKLTLAVYAKECMPIKLVIPQLCHKQAALDYRQEHFDHGEMEINGDGGLDHAQTYELWLEQIHGAVRPGYVMATTFFATAGGDIVGTIQVRHTLNDQMAHTGGHIGYGVRPSQRRKGYAGKMLALALETCRELKMRRALVTCDTGNTGSARTIVKNGGVLENEVSEDDGTPVQRYWIEL